MHFCPPLWQGDSSIALNCVRPNIKSELIQWCQLSHSKLTHLIEIHPYIEGRFRLVTMGHEKKNDLAFLVVMVRGSKTMTKRNPHHFSKVLVMGHDIFSDNRILCTKIKVIKTWFIQSKILFWWYTYLKDILFFSFFLLLVWLFHFQLRQPIWVLLLQNPGDRQTLPIYGHVGFHIHFHINFSFIFWHAHPRSLLVLVNLCQTNWDCPSFLNNWEMSESGGHGQWSLHWFSY